MLYLINKPFGTLSQFTREHPSHNVLGDLYDFPKDVYPIGRLDKDSEGLLLLSADKKWNNQILDPKRKLTKEYWVQVEGAPNATDLSAFGKGITIKLKSGPYKCLPTSAEIMAPPDNIWDRIPPIRERKNIPTTWLKIQLQEGKNRQVRKMCAKIGFPVLRLIRWRIGNWTLKGVSSGDVVLIDPAKSPN